MRLSFAIVLRRRESRRRVVDQFGIDVTARRCA